MGASSDERESVFYVILFIRNCIMRIHYLISYLFTSSSMTLFSMKEKGCFSILVAFATAGGMKEDGFGKEGLYQKGWASLL